jgi:hypothetical protein
MAGPKLAKYEAARHALAEAKRVDEAKSIRDKAVAMQVYARQAQDRTLINDATDIRLRAERRAGELLRGTAKNKGRRGQGRPRLGGRGNRPPKADDDAINNDMAHGIATLADLGVTKDQSSKWQKLAGLDESEFDAVVINAQRSAGAALDRAKAEPKPKPKPKPEDKAKAGMAAIVSDCLIEVENLVRRVCDKLIDVEQPHLFDELEKLIRKMRPATSDDPNRWSKK